MQQNVLFFLKHKNNVKFFYESLPFKDALDLMRRHGYTAMPVISERGVYKGTVTEGDFLFFIQDHYKDMTQESVMHKQVGSLVRKGFMPAVSVTVPLPVLFEASLQQNFVPVVDDRGIFIGIVTRKQIIRYLMDTTGNEEYIDNSISRSFYPDLKDE